MKKLITVINIILLCSRINAQVFTGTVYDKATNQPLPDVYVSFNGTTAYAITDNSGKFELTLAQRLNTQLVFSHIAYNMVIIENPFDEFPEEIYMEQRLNMLDNVIISEKVSPEYADPLTRAQKLRAFKEQFLGTTRAGKSCFIMNENDIELRFNVQTNTLYASSENPIVVVNEYLGYMVSYTLIDFRIEYAMQRSIVDPIKSPSDRIKDNDPRRTLDRINNQYFGTSTEPPEQKTFALSRSYHIQRSYFTVISLYTDLNPDDMRIKRRRDEIYEQSSTFFFKNIANNTLEESNFRIYENRRRQLDQSLYFTIEENDTLPLKKIQFIPDLGSVVNVMYGRNRASGIQFLTDTLLVDRYGNIDQFDKALFSGVMGQARAGDMLPIDYEP